MLRVLQNNPRIGLEHREAFEAAIERFAGDAARGFADCMIATLAAKHDPKILTFDKKLARLTGVMVMR